MDNAQFGNKTPSIQMRPSFLLFLTKMTLVFVDERIIYAISLIKLITDITASRTKRQTSRILEILWWCSAICTKHREKMNLEKQTFFLYFAQNSLKIMTLCKIYPKEKRIHFQKPLRLHNLNVKRYIHIIHRRTRKVGQWGAGFF